MTTYIIIIALAIIVVLAFMFFMFKCFNTKKTTPVQNPLPNQQQQQQQQQQPDLPPTNLVVLNCVTERQNERGTYEHVIYFSLQEEATYFRFFINNQLIGKGSFEDLDIRYAPPFRRVIFVTTDIPKLPMTVKVEALGNGKLIGRGELPMQHLCYHPNQ